MRIEMAHLRDQGIDFAVFNAEAPSRTGVDRQALLRQLPAAARGNGLKVDKALASLTFSRRRIAKDVKKTLESAIANAENNHDLDINNLVVAQAWVGKNLVMKRFMPNARGRVGKIEKFFSELTIIVREEKETA